MPFHFPLGFLSRIWLLLREDRLLQLGERTWFFCHCRCSDWASKLPSMPQCTCTYTPIYHENPKRRAGFLQTSPCSPQLLTHVWVLWGLLAAKCLGASAGCHQALRHLGRCDWGRPAFSAGLHWKGTGRAELISSTGLEILYLISIMQGRNYEPPFLLP